MWPREGPLNTIIWSLMTLKVHWNSLLAWKFLRHLIVSDEFGMHVWGHMLQHVTWHEFRCWNDLNFIFWRPWYYYFVRKRKSQVLLISRSFTIWSLFDCFIILIFNGFTVLVFNYFTILTSYSCLKATLAQTVLTRLNNVDKVRDTDHVTYSCHSGR